MKKGILIGIIFCFILSACNTLQSDIDKKEVALSEESKRDIEICLYIEKKVTLGKYEPKEGIYLGAYTEINSYINDDITVFEKLVGHPQTFRVFQYTNSNAISKKDILQCIAQKKVPYIKLLMPKKDPLNRVYQMIADLRSEYDTPIFIEIFPLTDDITDPMTYKNIYMDAHRVIKKYIKNSTIVWSVDHGRTYDMPLYYPGNKYVDWAGINIYIPKYKNNKVYDENIEQNLDFWYKNFQHSKPMMISALAISHFSTVDHTYTVGEAKDKLSMFYDTYTKNYPRLKGIIYIDVDMREVSSQGTDDYRITLQKQLTDYLKSKFKEDRFLDFLTEEKSSSANQLIKCNIPAVLCNDKIYISKEYTQTLFKGMTLSKIECIQDLNGEEYYLLEDIAQHERIFYEYP